MPLSKIAQRREEFFLTEIRPALFGNPQLGVTDLPEQVVTDSHFPRRTDHKVWVGHTGGIEMRLDRRLIHRIGVNLASGDSPRNGLHRIRNFSAATIIDRQT